MSMSISFACLVILAACTPSFGQYCSSYRPQTAVIIDTDLGSYIDDSYAIALALQNHHLDVKLIVTATDDTMIRAKILAKTLSFAGYDHIPIGIGPPDNLTTPHTLWGWAADYDLTKYPGGVHDFTSTLCLMKDILHRNAPRSEIIALGPLVNFPHYIQNLPQWLLRTVVVRSMAGSINIGYDNSSTPVAEYNVELCPECFNTMLRGPWSKVEITPLDTCGLVELTPKQVRSITYANTGLTNALVQQTLIWCTTGEIPCHLNIATIALPDTVAIFLALPSKFADLRLYRRKVIAKSDGFTRENNADGISVWVAESWYSIEKLNRFKQYVTDTIITGTIIGASSEK